MTRDPIGDEGCKHRGQIRDLLHALLEGFWIYFDKNGKLNSDGRRLAAKAARLASRSGCRHISNAIYNILNDRAKDDLRGVLNIIRMLGYDVGDEEVEASIYGPIVWRWRDTHK